MFFMKIAAIVTALFCTGAVYIHASTNGSGGGSPGQTSGRAHGAPGPVMGAAGAPLLAAYGVYALWRRRIRVS
jgi:uncharacterized membrane protein YphA (DoxX/SURF4 family)